MTAAEPHAASGASPADQAAAPLVVNGLRAGYGEREILHDVSVSVSPGEIRVVLGGSGSGKSTFLRNVLGLEIPWEGSIRLLGRETAGPGESPEGIHRDMGVLFQNGALITSLSVGENVALPLVLEGTYPADLMEEMARIRLGQVGLEHAYSLYPRELSGGMRKRAALARALVHDPALLFCDEPSAGLDPITARGLDDLLLELRDSQSISIVVITHELESIKALADRILFLHEGSAAFDGTLDEIDDRAPEIVKDFFARRIPGNAARRDLPYEVIP